MDGTSMGTNRLASRLVKVLTAFIVICITVTTIIHYCWPQLTGVPSHPVDIVILISTDTTVVVIGLFAFLHGRRTMGTEKAALFLLSSVLFSGFEETTWILSGRFGLLPQATYYFTYGGLWFFEIPVYTCIAWYLVCYCGYSLVKSLFPRMRPAGTAAMVAAFGTCWDLWLDPAVCNQHLVSALPDLWIWLSTGGARLFGIPIMNFAGWFGVIFTIVYVFDKKLRPEGELGTKRVGLYCLFLAIGWGLLFLALHGVIVLQAATTIDLLPVAFGSPVDPATAGTSVVAAALGITYVGFFVTASVYTLVIYRKGKVEKAFKLLPAILVGWWLNGGIGTAAQILMVYPGSTLVWIMLMSSAYPIILATWAAVSSRHTPGGSKPATTHAP